MLGNRKSRKLSQKQQASHGRKRRLRIIAGVIFLLFVIAANLLARTPKEYQAGVTFLPDDKLMSVLLRDIAEAKTDITCALYMFKTDGAKGDPTSMIQDAMFDALERGVRVSVTFDLAQKDDLSTKYNTHTSKTLAMAGAKVLFDDPEKRMHAKMCVIDESITFIGSHNYTYSGMRRNSEATVRVRSPEIALEALEYITGLSYSADK